MKLLSINNYHYRRAGSDGVFLDHNHLFQERGWSVAAFSMQHSDNLDSPWKIFFVKEIEFTQQISILQRLQQAMKVVYSTEARRQLKQLLYKLQPDVVHIHSIYHHISPAILPILGELDIPIVLTAHDYKLLCPAYKMFDGKSICEDCQGGNLASLIQKRCLHNSIAISGLAATETLLYRRLRYYHQYVDRIVCPSRFLLEKFVAWGWSREQLVHIRNFFDDNTWVPNFTPGRFMLYFGRMAPEKGLQTLLRACALANVPLKIIGWGNEESYLRSLADNINAPVEFISRLSASLLVAQIQAARAVILPSEWYENASLAILESFACGKPVIASRIGGNPELVFEGQNGWLFEAANVTALAGCLRQVWEMDDDILEQFGRRARSSVEQHFSSSIYYTAMMQLYSELKRCEPSNLSSRPE